MFSDRLLEFIREAPGAPSSSFVVASVAGSPLGFPTRFGGRALLLLGFRDGRSAHCVRALCLVFQCSEAECYGLEAIDRSRLCFGMIVRRCRCFVIFQLRGAQRLGSLNASFPKSFVRRW